MMQSIEPQAGASGLAPHPNRLTLRGTPAQAQFPPLCPRCGGHASKKIVYSKVFSRADVDGPSQYIVTSVAVPFCDACIAVYRAQEAKPALIDTLVTSFASTHVVGAVFPAFAAIFLARIAMGDVAHGRGTRALIDLGLCAIAAMIAWAQRWSVWRDRERFRVPPQTDVTKAFDFSDDTAPALEAKRFACAIQNGGSSNAFRVLNIENEYLPQSAQGISERQRSGVLPWIFGALVAAVAAWSFLKDLFA